MDLADLSFVAPMATFGVPAAAGASAGRVLVLCNGELGASELLIHTLRRVRFTVRASRPTRTGMRVA